MAEDPIWRVGSRSGGGDCVQVARVGDVIWIGDFKNPVALHLSLTLNVWQTLMRAIRGPVTDDQATSEELPSTSASTES